ncbi:unnamed protein product [Acanthoscelides obtectus]|uniref:Uncharacterized protein n=1 Tax=Acanthoscelides obtectus TaxID=200917 RepID=A0A9P0PT74_ACAOB|nr:unnamed protein product [Acanthoscelides obtectus]CAK1669575.1 hypothetical protein AOBTE_LOCUS27084 [Acanthoscelides obtectus]
MYSLPLYVGFGYFIVTVLADYPEKPTSYAYTYRVFGKKQKYTAKREYTFNNGYGKMVVSNFKSPPVVTSYSTYINHPADGPHEEAHFKQEEEGAFFGDDDEEIEKFWKIYDEEDERKEKEQIKIEPLHHEEHEENNFEKYWFDDGDQDAPEDEHKHVEVEDFDSKEYYSDYWKEFEDIDEEPYFQFPEETDSDFWNYFWNDFERQGGEW